MNGASSDKCSDTYAGQNGASEPEVRAFMKYILSRSPRWVSHISLHAYGAMWLSTYCYSKSHIQENFEDTVIKILLKNP